MRNRPTKQQRRARLTVERLCRRTLPSVTVAPDPLNAGKSAVVFSEDLAGSSDQLVLRSSSGLLAYSWNGAPFSTDLNTSRGGTQSLAITRISSIKVGLGGGDDSLTIDDTQGVIAPAPGGIGFDGGAGVDRIAAESNTNFVLIPSSLTISDGANVALVNVEQAMLTGGNSGNLIDASAFTGPTTLRGGNGNDSLIGGNGNDVIDGGQGSESLIGNGGDDTIFGGNSGSTLSGGSGNDSLIGGNGKDLLLGGSGHDYLFGGSGTDELDGGEGDDILTGGGGNDQLFGGDGMDRVVESGDVDWTLTDHALTGQGYGTESLVSIEEAVLTGGPSDRTLNASGFSGSVTLNGGGGSDILIGGTGFNRYVWSPGGTLTIFANGEDAIGFTNATSVISLNLTLPEGTSQVINAQGHAVILYGSFEQVIGGNFGNHVIGSGSTTLTGGDGDDTLEAGSGDSTVIGNGGTDLLYGGTGSDSIVAGSGTSTGTGSTILGGGGRDLLYGGSGNDSIIAGSGTTSGGGSTILGGGGRDILFGGTGSDSIVSGSGDTTIIGGGGDDLLYGGTGSDSIVAGSGSSTGTGSTILGGGGRDVLYGGTGSDSIVAGSGTSTGGGSTILGGGGRDVLYGGSGSDSIVSGSSSTGGTGSTILGGGGRDVLFGGAGVDRIEGGDDDDVIFAGIGGGSVFGGSGNDVIFGAEASDEIWGEDGNDLLYGQGGDDSILGGSGDDTIVGGVGNDSLSGGIGSDLYLFEGSSLGSDMIDEVANADDDTLDFSTFATAISVDLALTSAQVVSAGNLAIHLLSDSGIESVVGTRYGDQILGNERANRLLGTDALDNRGGPASPWNVRTQVVYLDFDSETGPGEYAYSTVERLAILSRMIDTYSAFRFEFTLTAPSGVAAYATMFFNKSPEVNGQPQPGGQASEYDFRNLNLGGSAAIDVNGLIGGDFQPAATSESFVGLSATIASHELAHLVGLRHADSFGPIGSGVHVTPGPGATLPVYPGPSGAFETTWHMMATPDSVGSTLDDAVAGPFFGEREAIKLSIAESGVVVPEQSIPHRTQSTAQALDLSRLSVPNTLKRGVNALKDFAVSAATVTGSILIDPATGFSESDYYSISGRAGDLLNFEIFSTVLDRIANPIDSILRLYDSVGNLVSYYTGFAENDDSFEGSRDSILFDLRLPSAGTFFIEVDTFFNDAVPDTETGDYELLVYRFDAGISTDGNDVLVGRGGDDQLFGGLGDDSLNSGVGSDRLEGGLGNDGYVLVPGGADVIVDLGGRDTLDFSTASSGVTLNLGSIAGQVQTIGSAGATLAMTGQAEVVIGSAFNDNFNGATATGSLALFGGAGNDSLTGGAGNDILIGGDGNDVIAGNNGRDILVGGNGSDRLNGGDGDDILIGGRTTFDQDLIALDAILAEWTSEASYDTRVDRLIGAVAGGANGSYRLIKGQTVLDDGLSDTLTGGLGLDLFFAFPLDSNDKEKKERRL